MSDVVAIRDVGPRDGLQGERAVDLAQRVELVRRLAAAGISDIEVASFVSPAAVPAMAGAADVVARLADEPALDGVRTWALVPNARGAELAAAAGVERLTITVSASEAYSQKNTHMSREAALARLADIRAAAPGAVCDLVVSFAFGSAFPDEQVTPTDIAAVAERAAGEGIGQLTLADTTGVATPRRIADVLSEVGTGVGLHLHDTRGTALLNAWAAIEAGVRRFDTALGGLGGSPFAPTAGGNLATEDLVMLLDDQGVVTGIDLEALLATGPFLRDLVGHELPSRVAAAGGLAPATEREGATA